MTKYWLHFIYMPVIKITAGFITMLDFRCWSDSFPTDLSLLFSLLFCRTQKQLDYFCIYKRQKLSAHSFFFLSNVLIIRLQNIYLHEIKLWTCERSLCLGKVVSTSSFSLSQIKQITPNGWKQLALIIFLPI